MKEQLDKNYEAILQRRLADIKKAEENDNNDYGELMFCHYRLIDQRKAYETLTNKAPWITNHQAFNQLMQAIESRYLRIFNRCPSKPVQYGLSLFELRAQLRPCHIEEMLKETIRYLYFLQSMMMFKPLYDQFNDTSRFTLLCNLLATTIRTRPLCQGDFLRNGEVRHFTDQTLKNITELAVTSQLRDLSRFLTCLNDENIDFLDKTELTPNKLAFIEATKPFLYSVNERKLNDYFYLLDQCDGFFDAFTAAKHHFSNEYLQGYINDLLQTLEDDPSYISYITEELTTYPLSESCPEKISMLEIDIYAGHFLDAACDDIMISPSSDVECNENFMLKSIVEKFILELRSSGILRENALLIDYSWTFEKITALMEIQEDGKSLWSHILQWLNKHSEDTMKLLQYFGSHITLAQDQSLELLKQLLIKNPTMGDIISSCVRFDETIKACEAQFILDHWFNFLGYNNIQLAQEALQCPIIAGFIFHNSDSPATAFNQLCDAGIIEVLLEYKNSINLKLILGIMQGDNGAIGPIGDKLYSTDSFEFLLYAQNKVLSNGATLLSTLLASDITPLKFIYLDHLAKKNYEMIKNGWNSALSASPLISSSEDIQTIDKNTNNSDANQPKLTIAIFDDLIQSKLLNTILTFQPGAMFSQVLSQFDSPEIIIKNIVSDFMAPLQPRTSLMYDLYERMCLSGLQLFDNYVSKFADRNNYESLLYVQLLSTSVEDYMVALSKKFTSQTRLMEDNFTRIQQYLLQNPDASLSQFIDILSNNIEKIHHGYGWSY